MPTDLTAQFLCETYPELAFTDAGRERLEEALALAAKRNLLANFVGRLNRLAEFARGAPDGKTWMSRDRAPASFFFEAPGLCGGLLYFGPGDTGTDTPQFSTRVGSSDEGWEIHT